MITHFASKSDRFDLKTPYTISLRCDSRAWLNSNTASISLGHKKVREFKWISSSANWNFLTKLNSRI